jgi:hypothetical protein
MTEGLFRSYYSYKTVLDNFWFAWAVTKTENCIRLTPDSHSEDKEYSTLLHH